MDSHFGLFLISCTAALGLLASGLVAAPGAAAQPASDSAAARTSWYAFPTLYYTPETSLGGGVAGGYFFPLGAGRPSSLQGDASVTLRSQYALNLRLELYRRGGRQRLFGDLALSKYPGVFYGIGPATTEAMDEDFTSRFVDATVQVEQQVAPALRLGVRARFRHEVVTEVEEGGLLDGSGIPGDEGSTASGVGPVVTRDRVFYPRRGQYVTAYALVHGRWLGSTFDFSRFVVDMRQYAPLEGQHVLAVQLYGEAVSGEAPFSVLPRLGGPLRMRGYFEGRYRDDVFATVQGEWRFPVWWRFDGALFAGTGAVADRLGRFAADGLERAAGIGLRYRLNDEGVHIRVDYAVGREGGGLYITAQEPF